MSRPRLLDLFCCEGGAGRGYADAGFEVVGVDSRKSVGRRYPFEFHHGDAMTWPLDGFDAVHASPPCQDHSVMRWIHGRDHGTAWMLDATIDRLRAWGGVWVVENVSGADMAGSLTLCGSEFGLGALTRDGRRRVLKRHRQFVSSVFLMGAGGCMCAGRPVIGVYGNGGGDPNAQVRGYKGTKGEMQEAMGMTWSTVAGMSQAIPPAYTRFIGEQLLAAL